MKTQLERLLERLVPGNAHYRRVYMKRALRDTMLALLLSVGIVGSLMGSLMMNLHTANAATPFSGPVLAQLR
ncbi:hypothetical protein MAIT1_01186 [Magnetofaba australis IT-1]|uniref:Uncharacterized protein n=1 Tax=Magnetofaba australis IT-1 TaxID=1434232 RepID=A0A1Y2K7A8_9PROT|nr:hypothetical protein MAIT1_01186 [Magnetofaba australis IT-1]